MNGRARVVEHWQPTAHGMARILRIGRKVLSVTLWDKAPVASTEMAALAEQQRQREHQPTISVGIAPYRPAPSDHSPRAEAWREIGDQRPEWDA